MANKLNEILKKQKEQMASANVSKDSDNDDIIQLVGFVVGDEEYAVPILNIREIIKPIEFTRVPSVPNYVMGVFNIRGSVIPLINLRLKFNLPEENNTDATRYIVMKGKEITAGFMIDRLTEAIRIKKSRIDPPPETMSDNGMIYGIGKRENSMLTILKVDELLKREF